MMPSVTSRIISQNIDVFTLQKRINVIHIIESGICTTLLMNLVNVLLKSNQMLDNPELYRIFPPPFNKFRKNINTHVRSSISVGVFVYSADFNHLPHRDAF